MYLFADCAVVGYIQVLVETREPVFTAVRAANGQAGRGRHMHTSSVRSTCATGTSPKAACRSERNMRVRDVGVGVAGWRLFSLSSGGDRVSHARRTPAVDYLRRIDTDRSPDSIVGEKKEHPYTLAASVPAATLR